MNPIERLRFNRLIEYFIILIIFLFKFEKYFAKNNDYRQTFIVYSKSCVFIKSVFFFDLRGKEIGLDNITDLIETKKHFIDSTS